MKTTFFRITFGSLLLSLSVALGFTLRVGGLSCARGPSSVVPSAGPAESIAPISDASVFSAAAAQVRPDLAPYCDIPEHAASVDVDQARSFVLSFRTPCPDYVRPSPLFQFLRPSLVPDCRFVRHHVLLIPASQRVKADIAYLPLRMEGKARSGRYGWRWVHAR